MAKLEESIADIQIASNFLQINDTKIELIFSEHPKVCENEPLIQYK